jgi:hypothetical protein
MMGTEDDLDNLLDGFASSLLKRQSNSTDVLDEFKKPVNELKPVTEPPMDDAFMQALSQGMQDLFKEAGLPNVPIPESTSTEPSVKPATSTSFSETVQATMSKLQSSSNQATSEAALESEEDLIAMMRDFSKMLEGEDLDSALSGFLNEIMSREILYEPLKELSLGSRNKEIRRVTHHECKVCQCGRIHGATCKLMASGAEIKPAQGPIMSEICGMTPEAATFRWKISA